MRKTIAIYNLQEADSKEVKEIDAGYSGIEPNMMKVSTNEVKYFHKSSSNITLPND